MKLFKNQTIRLYLTMFFIYSTHYLKAAELDGAGRFLLKSVFGLLLILGGIIYMFYYFREDKNFLLFSVFNLIVMVIIIAIGSSADSDKVMRFFAGISYFQITLQIFALIKAFNKKKSSSKKI